MSCPFCGKKILDEEAPYCPYCGKELKLTPSLSIKTKAEQEKWWICEDCKTINSPERTACNTCGRPISYAARQRTRLESYGKHYEDYEGYDQPSSVWYLVAFLFGLIGGLIAYVAVKDKDEDMAYVCVVIGVVTTLIGAAIAWIFLSSF